MKPIRIGELLALPLQSAVRAQVLALQETMAAIETIGIQAGHAKVFRLKAERSVEERTVDPASGLAETKLTVQPFEVSIPILALLPIQTIKLQELDVDFGVQVLETISEPIVSAAADAPALSLAGSLAIFGTYGQPGSPTINVHMKIAKDSSEGIARLNDLLADLLSAGPTDRRLVKDIEGVSADVAGRINAAGITTLTDFLAATATRADRTKLATLLRVPLARVDTWRRAAEKLARE